ncbi:hypothetical protein OXX59_006358 [Metschnikowia pulcherrima]
MKLAILAALLSIVHSSAMVSPSETDDALNGSRQGHKHVDANTELSYRITLTSRILEIEVKGLAASLVKTEADQLESQLGQARSVVSQGSPLVEKACRDGANDRFCAYYSFNGYSHEVQTLAKNAESARSHSRVEAGLFSSTKAFLQRQVAYIGRRMDQLDAAPVELWEAETEFKNIQTLKQNTKNVLGELAHFLAAVTPRAGT